MGVSVSRSVSRLVAEMAHIVGVDDVDPANEHARWNVYSRAMNSSDLWGILREAVQLEPDSAVAMSVVLRMLERVSANERSSWVDALPAGKDHDFAERRAAEIHILETVGGKNSPSPSELRSSFDAGWSTWLQLRLTESSVHDVVLTHLSEHGATKRVRAAARSRLRRGDAS